MARLAKKLLGLEASDEVHVIRWDYGTISGFAKLFPGDEIDLKSFKLDIPLPNSALSGESEGPFGWLIVVERRLNDKGNESTDWKATK